MATPVVAQSILGMKSLIGVSGPQLAPRARGGFNGKRDLRASVKGTSDSVAIRALSGKDCSSSSSLHLGLSQSSSTAIFVPRKSSGSRRSSVRASANGGHDFGSGRSSTDGVQFLDIDQNSVGRNSGSAINSVTDDHTRAENDESVPSPRESEPVDDAVSRPQPILQGFADSPFVESFALDLTAGGVGGNGSPEFEAVSVSAMPMYQPQWVWFAKSPEEENLFIDRAINATIVASAGILAVTKLLTVDHDYWQGWTLVEILKYAPVHNWFAYEELLKTHPVLAKMMISGFVYSLGDWIAQCYGGKGVFEFSRTRMLRSGLVGFCLHGSMSHFYYHFCEWLFPFQGWWVLPLKVGFDQTAWSALWNSTYFITIGILRFESPAEIWKELRSTFIPLLTAGWKLWPFAHLVTYGLVPVEQRLLWVDMVEIVWVTILAMYSNEKAEARIAETETGEIKEGAKQGVLSAVSADEE